MTKNEETMAVHDVCIIGAGLAGLSAARILAEHGINDVVVLDKGRSVGGRFATRRMGIGRADHGAQFMSARSALFREWAIERDLSDGALKLWFSEKGDKFVAKNGMNDWLKLWSERLPATHKIWTGVEVESIEEQGAEWLISGREGFHLRAKALLITAPLPQALTLTDSLHETWHKAEHERLRAVQYAPCLALLISLSSSSDVPAPGYCRSDLPAPLAWVADNRQKGISSETILTVHLDAEWSTEHYADSDEAITTAVLPGVRTLIPEQSIIQELQVKRWRYALSSNLYPNSYFVAPHDAPLLLAGDGFSSDPVHAAGEQGRAETACLSGVAAANHLLQYFEKTARTSS
jgi:renalase